MSWAGKYRASSRFLTRNDGGGGGGGGGGDDDDDDGNFKGNVCPNGRSLGKSSV